MSDSFLETEQTLHQMMEELERFRAASEQLTLTRDGIANLMDSTKRLTGRTTSVIEKGEQQLTEISRLTNDSEQRISAVIGKQESLANDIERQLKNALQQISDLDQRLRSMDRQQTEATASLDKLLRQEIRPSLAATQDRLSTVRTWMFISVAIGLGSLAVISYLLLLSQSLL
jgi:hypothetical protein